MQQRIFNVSSPVVVTYPGEHFAWTVNPSQIPSGDTAITVQPNAGVNWYLDKNSYSVGSGSNQAAKVSKQAVPGEYLFHCSPGALNVATQRLIIVPKPATDPSQDVNVLPGGCFIWVNENQALTTIEPDPANNNYWPLPQPAYVVRPNSWLALEVPTDALAGSYGLIVSGGSAYRLRGQPKIIIGTSLGHRK